VLAGLAERRTHDYVRHGTTTLSRPGGRHRQGDRRGQAPSGLPRHLTVDSGLFLAEAAPTDVAKALRNSSPADKQVISIDA
jgi:hypothetical protein